MMYKRGTIVRLSKPDPDDIAEHFSDTEYPVFGVVRSAGLRPLCWMSVGNKLGPEGWHLVSWYINEKYLTVVEEP